MTGNWADWSGQRRQQVDDGVLGGGGKAEQVETLLRWSSREGSCVHMGWSDFGTVHWGWTLRQIMGMSKIELKKPKNLQTSDIHKGKPSSYGAAIPDQPNRLRSQTQHVLRTSHKNNKLIFNTKDVSRLNLVAVLSFFPRPPCQAQPSIPKITEVNHQSYPPPSLHLSILKKRQFHRKFNAYIAIHPASTLDPFRSG